MRPNVKKWSIVIGAVTVVVLAGVVLPWIDWDKASDAVQQWTRPKPKVVQLGPVVLLVSTQERDRYLVRSTLEPRGYAVQMADTVDHGTQILNQEGAAVTMVVVDSAVPGSKKLLQAAKAKFPKARLIELRGYRDASDVSAVLVNAVSGT